MKPVILSVLFFASSLAFAETPQEVARRIISSDTAAAHNPLNRSEAELNRAATINSQLRLRSLMLGDTVSDELRTCYALQIIERHIKLAQSLHNNERAEAFIRDRDTLATHFRQLGDLKR